MRLPSALLVLLLAACGPSAGSPSPDAGEDDTMDAGSPPDAGSEIDAGAEPDAGSPVDAGTDDAPYSCEPAASDDACDTCQKASCCDVSKSCFDDPRCDAYFRCANPCPTSACADDCEREHPDGFRLFATWYLCLEDHCPTACGLD